MTFRRSTSILLTTFCWIEVNDAVAGWRHRRCHRRRRDRQRTPKESTEISAFYDRILHDRILHIFQAHTLWTVKPAAIPVECAVQKPAAPLATRRCSSSFVVVGMRVKVLWQFPYTTAHVDSPKRRRRRLSISALYYTTWLRVSICRIELNAHIRLAPGVLVAHRSLSEFARQSIRPNDPLCPPPKTLRMCAFQWIRNWVDQANGVNQNPRMSSLASPSYFVSGVLFYFQ